MTHLEGNPGVWPVDFNSPEGSMRLAVGDFSGTPYGDENPGLANFTYFSDEALRAILCNSDSRNRAIGQAFLYLAGEAAKESTSVKDYDLQVDLTKRAADLRATAQVWFDRAALEDADDLSEAFEIVPTGTRSGGFIPEGTLPQWGRQYTWSRIR